MLTLDRSAGVTRLHFASRRSRSVGYSVSAFLVDDVLIDTGFPGVAGDLIRVLDELRPRVVAITHWHEDHGGNAELVAGRGLPISAGDATLETLRARPRIGLYRRAVWGTPPALRSPVERADLGRLRLIPTPGHSADHHVIWDAHREVVFAGDVFLGVKVRALHRSEDPRTHASSVRRVAELRPKVLYDAHRGALPDPVPALIAKADWIDEMIGRIEQRIVDGWGDRAIAGAVLGPPDLITAITFGDLSKVNFVRAVRRTMRRR